MNGGGGSARGIVWLVGQQDDGGGTRPPPCSFRTERFYAIMREQTHLDGLSVAAARPARESGAPLLFVHGLFAAGWMLERWMAYFAEGGRVAYALD